MKFKVLGILMICLMVSGVAFATNSWKAVGGETYWSENEGSGWSAGLPANPATEQLKLANNSGAYKACTLDIAVPAAATSLKLTVGGTATSGLWADSPQLFIVTGANLGIGNELQIGDSSSKRGRLTQTGGTVAAVGTGKIEVGYKSTAGYGGTYTISGGTITGESTSKFLVGGSGAANSEGVLTIHGSDASITAGTFGVGTNDSAGVYAGKGTVAFEVVNGAVSAVHAGSVYIDPIAVAGSITTLLVSGTGSVPTNDILLIESTGVFTGVFDGTIEGTVFAVNGVNMTLTYLYNGATSTRGTGNDMALLIPEPATIALLGLGLLAMRRNRK